MSSEQDRALGQDQSTPRGVSPQPTAERPEASSTRRLQRAQVMWVTREAPNFSGSLGWAGRI